MPNDHKNVHENVWINSSNNKIFTNRLHVYSVAMATRHNNITHVTDSNNNNTFSYANFSQTKYFHGINNCTLQRKREF